MTTNDRTPEILAARRAFLARCGAAVVAAAVPAGAIGAAASQAAGAAPSASAAQVPAAVLLRKIPRTGEELPVVGLGTNAYGVTAAADIEQRKAVIARMLELGGRVVDTARAYGDSELVVGGIMKDLGARSRVFLATKTPIQGDLSEPKKIVAETFARLGTDTVDLLQIHNMHGVDALLPTMRELQEQKRVRYLGATTSRDDQYDALLAAMRAHPLDFIQIDYSIANRDAAQRVLPLAAERGMGVLVNVPYGGRRDGNLLRKLGDRPLPPFARDIGAESWGEVLLKYVISHPAVTCAIPGTTNPKNIEANLRAARGPLPDAAMRATMEKHWDSLSL